MSSAAPPVHPSEELRGARETVEERGPSRFVKDVGAEAASNHLLVLANAVAFRVVLAIVPLSLLGIALLGFLSLEDVWRDSLSPEIRERTSPEGFAVLERTVERVLGTKEGFWLTVGAALALWEVSSGVRVTMHALDQVYGVGVRRGLWERFAVSIGLSFPLAGFLLGALAVAQVLPPLIDRRAGWGLDGEIAARIVGWGFAILLLAGAVGLVLRYGPSERQPFRIVGWSTALIVVSWAAISALFGVYVTQIASYGSVFGGLAAVFLLMLYVYLAVIAFLLGVQLDAYLRRIAEQERSATRSQLSGGYDAGRIGA